MIKISDLNKSYHKNTKINHMVLDGLTLELNSQGLTIIHGASGCGKTTLFNCIGGLDDFENGSINIDGVSFCNKVDDSYRKQYFAYIFQDYNLIENETVERNIMFAMELCDAYTIAINKYVVEILDVLGIKKLLRRRVCTLSGGQKQRVAIARALSVDCKYLLAGEPTGNLDRETSISIMNLLKSISRKRPVVMVTHDIDLAELYADRLIELSDGKIISDNSNCDKRIDINEDNAIEKAMVKKKLVIGEIQINLTFFENNDKHTVIDLEVKNETVYVQKSSNISVVEKLSGEEQDNKKKIIPPNNISNELPKLQRVSCADKNISKSIFYGSGEQKRSRLKSILAVILILVGISIGISTCMISSIEPTKIDYLKHDERILRVDNKVGEYGNIIDKIKETTDFILPYNEPFKVALRMNNFQQYNNYLIEYDELYATPIPIEYQDASKNIMYGRNIQSSNEVLIDLFLFNKAEKEQGANRNGAVSAAGLLGNYLRIDKSHEYKIVGITNWLQPSIFIEKNELMSLQYEKLFMKKTKVIDIPSGKIEVTEGIFNSIYPNVDGKRMYLLENFEYEVVAKANYIKKDEEIIYINTSDLEHIILKKIERHFAGIYIFHDTNKTYNAERGDFGVARPSDSDKSNFLSNKKDSQTIAIVMIVMNIIVAVLITHFYLKTTLIDKKAYFSTALIFGKQKKHFYIKFTLSYVKKIITTVLPFFIASFIITSIIFFGVCLASLWTFFLGVSFVLAVSFTMPLIECFGYINKTPIEITKDK